jgi:hypothetical protein
MTDNTQPKYFAIYFVSCDDDGACSYRVRLIQAKDQTHALATPVAGNEVIDVVEVHKFERVMASLTFPTNPIHYQWAYMTARQEFWGLGHHRDPDQDELEEQALSDYGRGIAQEVLILDAREALLFLESAHAAWESYQQEITS